MDRQTVYPGQIPLETDLLNTNKFAMIALAKLAAAMLGTATVINGLGCVPTGPASLQVVVNPGEVYSLANVDATAYSSLPADTTHNILKQGILLDAVTLSCPAPATAGQSVNYLIQAAYLDTDTGLITLPYYNASNPTQAWAGPGNSGAQQATARKGIVNVTVKAGVSATTGSQVTPAPDAGYTGLWVVTVANGQTTITSANIAQAANAPILPADLLHAIQQNALTTAVDTGAANAYAVSYSPAITALTDGMVLWFKAKTANSGASTLNVNGLGAQPLVGGAHSALQGGEIVAGGKCQAVWRADISSWVLLECTGGALQVAPSTQSNHAVQLGQMQASTGSAGSTAWRNELLNSSAEVAQGSAVSLSTSPQYGLVDMATGWASGGAISAGTLTQDTAAPVGRTGKAVRFQGCTLTGPGQLSWRYRMEAADAVKLKNQTTTFQIKVQHNVGAAINYTVVIRKPTAADNFTSTTVIGTSAATSVPSGASTALLFTQALGDCSNGLEIEVQAACGAVTTKDFWWTEWGIEEGSTATPVVFRPFAVELAACQRYYRLISVVKMWSSGIAGQVFGQSITFPTMRVAPTVTVGSWSYSNASGGGFELVAVDSLNINAAATTSAYAWFNASNLTLSARL